MMSFLLHKLFWLMRYRRLKLAIGEGLRLSWGYTVETLIRVSAAGGEIILDLF